MRSVDTRRTAFRALHDVGCFAIPNPWDRGTAVALAALGFRALATSSAGFAFSQGLPDTPTALGVDDALGHIADIVEAVDLPVNADFQAGYADDPGQLAENVERCVATGVAGFSLEDATGPGADPILPVSHAADRIRVARAAIDQSKADVLLTARAESILYGHTDLSAVTERLRAYVDAGADVVFAPGIRDSGDIAAVVEAVDPVPVNVLISSDTGLTIADLASLGVRRVSVGSALSRVAWGAFLRAARGIADDGSFGMLDGAASFGELNRLFEQP